MGYRLRVISFCLAAVLLCACQNVPEVEVTVRERASMPGEGLTSACVAVMGEKAYVFAGRENSTYKNELWEYDSRSDSWTNLGSTPLKARVNATMAALDGKLYMGLGYSARSAYKNESYQRDWWEYTPAMGTWKQLADYPTANTVAISSFVDGGQIYTLFGFGYGYTKDIYRYDAGSNTWTYVEPHQPRAWMNFGGRGALCHGLLYFGLGYRTSNLTQWYEVDLQSDTWTKRRSLPGKGREFAACAATNEHVYILGGRHFAGDMTGGEIFDSFLRYAPDKDEWTWCGTMPCGRAENQIGFSIGGKVYFGLGEDEQGHTINKLYCIE